MTRPFTAAARAFEETLEGLEPPISQRELGDPEDLGRRAALLAVADAVWRRHLGPSLDGKQVQRLLGVRTRQAVSDLVKRGRLLALPAPSGRLTYPSFQFGTNGRPHSVLPAILSHLGDAGVSAHTIASWFRTRQPLLRNETPAAWLESGRDAELVIEAARRSAARLGR